MTDGGKAVHTVVVGQKGDNIAFTGRAGSLRLAGVSSSINVAFNPTNGANDWARKGPKGASEIGTSGGRAKGCAGDGPMQCYSVSSERVDRKNVVASFERTFEASGAHGAVNGILNPLGRAMELMASHVRSRYGASSFLLAHNPTEGFARDLVESTRDKIGWTTAAASQFADILASADQPMSWVAHSQGGVIFSEAMRVNLNHGVTDMSYIRVAFHGGANNRWVTNRYAARGGAGVVGYYDAPNDLVPQVIGLRAWNRPDRIMRSIFSAPLLFGERSPHTYPVDPEY